jgi:transcriptional regulator with XRE-family HTH domain
MVARHADPAPQQSRLDDPAVQRRRLTVELRRARLAAGQTQREVADAMDWSTSKVIRIESGETGISRNDLKALLEHYGIADTATVNALIESARVAREDNWARYRSVYNPNTLKLFDFERSAAIIRETHPSYISGLLQTEEYCESLQQDVYHKTPEDAEVRWEGRLKRQALHDRDSPPQVHVILDEAVIVRPVGGARVMSLQLEAVVDFASLPHVKVQIVPFSRGATPIMEGPFILLSFEDPNDEDVLYLEHDSYTIRDSPELTNEYFDRFLELEEKALSPDDSIALIKRTIQQMAEPQVTNGKPGSKAPQATTTKSKE